MWFAYSWFDGEDGTCPTHAAPPSSRVLHTGREYTVGRKEGAVDLCIPLFRISRMAGTLRVTAMTPEQVSDPSCVPQVFWTMHARSKSGSLIEGYRGKNRVEQRIRVDSPVPLSDRARVRLVGDVYLEVRWVACTFGIVRVPALDSEDARIRAAASGAHLVFVRESLDVRCTHLCVAHVRPNRMQLLALVRGLPIVTAAYVEAALACPSESAWPDSRFYTPPLDARLTPETPISAAQLAPVGRRAFLFRGTTLVFLLPGRERRYVGGRLTQTDLEELAAAAEAHVVVHDVSRHPLATVKEAIAVLKDAQSASDAHWSASAAVVPVQETFVLCGETGAPWAATVAEAAQRYVIG